MRGILAPFLMTIVGAIGVTHTEAARDLYLADYPDDPLRRAALDRCGSESPSCNRLSAPARAHCYAPVTPSAGASTLASDYVRRAPSAGHHVGSMRSALAPPAAYRQAFKEKSAN